MPPTPSGKPPASQRWSNVVLAALYFTVCAMVLYFRFVPFRRVVERFDREGVAFPAWFHPVFTAGTAVVVLFLLWRGILTLRRALRP